MSENKNRNRILITIFKIQICCKELLTEKADDLKRFSIIHLNHCKPKEFRGIKNLNDFNFKKANFWHEYQNKDSSKQNIVFKTVHAEILLLNIFFYIKINNLFTYKIIKWYRRYNNI